MTVKILSIESATDACSVALRIAGKTAQRFEVAPRRQSARLLPMVDELLAQASLSLGELDALAVGRGPGSFTGVRLAVSVAQGLAYGAQLPVAGISTLQALAQQAIEQEKAEEVLVALDARMEEVYCAHFVSDNGLARAVSEETVCRPEAITCIPSKPFVAIGSGWETYQDLLLQKCSPQKTIENAYPEAQAIALLGEKAFLANDLCDAKSLLPVYLRDNVV